MFHADRDTHAGGRTDQTKLIVAFCNSGNVVIILRHAYSVFMSFMWF